jgi:S-disulfanyl-L-cysteine oxidoreductase SoxD
LKSRAAVIGAGGVLLFLGALLATAAPQSAPIPAAAPSTSSVWDGVYTEAQAKRGQAFAAQSCAGCHGVDINSGEPGPWLHGKDFAWRYDGRTVADLFIRLNTMPPDQPGVFGPDAMADFAAFVLWANDFPIGKQELPSDLAALDRIWITVKKP